MPHYKFEAITGIFEDFAPACVADPTYRVGTQPDLAILKRSYPGDSDADKNLTQWERLTKYVERLNAEADKTVRYRIVYLTRHGVGDHNATIRKVGTKAWDETIGKLDTYDGLLLRDARLNDEGKAQATHLSGLWTEFLAHGLPFPTTLYCSPLTRCLQTCKLVFNPLTEAQGKPYHPTVKELLRERMTDHTCDSRSSRSYIAKDFPEYIIEEGFTENDELWRADRFEPLHEHLTRKQKVLEDIFAKDGDIAISLAIHSQAVAAVMNVCGLVEYRVREGTSHALLVKATEVPESPVFNEADYTEIAGL